MGWDERFITGARRVLTEVVTPLVGLGGFIWLLSDRAAPDRPTLVLACLALIGYTVAGVADRTRTRERRKDDDE